jgi:condensin complex subunit 3
LDPNCPIIKAYLFHLACDPSAVVRRTVIKNIGASRYTLGFVLRKTKDIDDSVRAASFTFLSEKVILFGEVTNTLDVKSLEANI